MLLLGVRIRSFSLLFSAFYFLSPPLSSFHLPFFPIHFFPHPVSPFLYFLVFFFHCMIPLLSLTISPNLNTLFQPTGTTNSAPAKKSREKKFHGGKYREKRRCEWSGFPKKTKAREKNRAPTPNKAGEKAPMQYLHRQVRQKTTTGYFLTNFQKGPAGVSIVIQVPSYHTFGPAFFCQSRLIPAEKNGTVCTTQGGGFERLRREVHVFLSLESVIPPPFPPL